jgi:predicted nucleic acid-binding protein
MSGPEFLLDTNLVIGLLKATPEAIAMKDLYRLTLDKSAVSQITRMELLGFPNLDAGEDKQIRAFLESITVLMINSTIETEAIILKRQHRVKLPDAIIAATAHIHALQLLTLDERLAKLSKDGR